ncbi:hypothetical protein CON65_15940 [Bacillus pseudomycoides]|uniref:DUF2577 domain-containing protein n=1 Tax=Bacillus pseudomycoides TaxID=64104 RepID=A0AA91VAL9_9BACI|nr:MULTISPECIES: DUF2577 family protein [Bacillus]PEB56247.1 hypothetical protein COO03_01375 [Bacillus sp. AFS098217]PED81677.1 hypothetical protein CON65_15940 [Bacillus pseudomycoides]
MNGIVELAKLFKDRENEPYEGYVIGEVMADFPDVKIKIDDNIHLDVSHLVFAAHLLSNYTREYEIVDEFSVTTGKIKWTDTIKKGDRVILVPSQNGQSYIVIDKAVTFNVSGN